MEGERQSLDMRKEFAAHAQCQFLLDPGAQNVLAQGLQVGEEHDRDLEGRCERQQLGGRDRVGKDRIRQTRKRLVTQHRVDRDRQGNRRKEEEGGREKLDHQEGECGEVISGRLYVDPAPEPQVAF